MRRKHISNFWQQTYIGSSSRVIVHKTTAKFLVTNKMRQQSAQPAIVPEETAALPPPRVDWGAHVTFFQLRSSLDGKITEKSVHTNLVDAVSPPIKECRWRAKEYRGNLVDISERMPGVTTEVFDILIKWLYTGHVRIMAPSNFEADQFWALVFQMSEQFEISDLKQIAFSRFEAWVSPGGIPSTDQSPIFPSKQLFGVFFDKGDCTGILQSWIVDHIFWMYKYAPSLLDEIESSMKLFPAIANGFCARLFRGESTMRHHDRKTDIRATRAAK